MNMDIKVGEYILDKQQQEIVMDDSKYLLVTAGAGSGKTLTILGKIKHLTTSQNINPQEIICISFTKAAVESIKEKIKKELGLDINVYTFHKLSLVILQEKGRQFEIADNNILDYIIHDFLYNKILKSPKHMKIVLNYFNQFPIRNVKSRYRKFCQENSKKMSNLHKLVKEFIELLKCNGYTLQNFTYFLCQIKCTLFYNIYKKEKRLLIIILNIYLQYMTYLEESREVDFNDMIILATKQIKDQGLKKKIKYLIIDEYQDTSYLRFQLIKEILNKTNAKLMVVGDDFQSIYRFTGCDLSLFLDFKKYFPNASIRKIERTYRNSQELISIAGKFVMKNEKQIKKNLQSKKNLKNPLKIIYYDNIKLEFQSLIETIYKSTKEPILVLGRNNNDIDLLLNENIKYKEKGKIIYTNNKSIKLKYMNIHKSKGLESENVIIINLIDKETGFPNKMKNERILRLVSKTYENFPYSEERRLFYVALTRTKNYVYLLVPNKNTSIFVKEVLKDNRQINNT